MKPTKEQIQSKYFYDGVDLVFAVDSGRHGKYKAGTRAGSLNNSGVRMVLLDGTYYQAHQIIWCLVYGEWPKRAIRHVNGDLGDNRIENLEMDSKARGKRDGPLSVERLKEVLNYCHRTGKFTWKVSLRNRTLPGEKAGFMNDSGYMICVIDQQRIRLHHAAWAIYYGEMPNGQIDHINRIRSDNRIVNLRIATRSENNQNTTLRKSSKNKVKGVHLRKDTGKYSASITVDKKTIWLGCFENLDDAKSARIEAEKKYHPYRAEAH